MQICDLAAFYLVEMRHVTKRLTKSENLKTSNLRMIIDILDLARPYAIFKEIETAGGKRNKFKEHKDTKSPRTEALGASS